MPKILFTQLECPSPAPFPDAEVVHQPNDDGYLNASSVLPDARTDVVDLLHFSNVTGDIAAEETLAAEEEHY